jgi:hypothetical protein
LDWDTLGPTFKIFEELDRGALDPVVEVFGELKGDILGLARKFFDTAEDPPELWLRGNASGLGFVRSCISGSLGSKGRPSVDSGDIISRLNRVLAFLFGLPGDREPRECFTFGNQEFVEQATTGS